MLLRPLFWGGRLYDGRIRTPFHVSRCVDQRCYYLDGALSSYSWSSKRWPILGSQNIQWVEATEFISSLLSQLTNSGVAQIMCTALWEGSRDLEELKNIDQFWSLNVWNGVYRKFLWQSERFSCWTALPLGAYQYGRQEVGGCPPSYKELSIWHMPASSWDVQESHHPAEVLGHSTHWLVWFCFYDLKILIF
jgi:hypothetical protein